MFIPHLVTVPEPAGSHTCTKQPSLSENDRLRWRGLCCPRSLLTLGGGNPLACEHPAPHVSNGSPTVSPGPQEGRQAMKLAFPYPRH